MFLATLDSTNFRFTALGDTEADAVETLRQGWDAHRDQFPRGRVISWKQAREHYSVSVVEIHVGLPLRDDRPLFPEPGTRVRDKGLEPGHPGWWGEGTVIASRAKRGLKPITVARRHDGEHGHFTPDQVEAVR